MIGRGLYHLFIPYLYQLEIEVHWVIEGQKNILTCLVVGSLLVKRFGENVARPKYDREKVKPGIVSGSGKAF